MGHKLEAFTTKFDEEANSAYLTVREGEVAATKTVLEGKLNVDVDDKGELLGIEILFG